MELEGERREGGRERGKEGEREGGGGRDDRERMEGRQRWESIKCSILMYTSLQKTATHIRIVDKHPSLSTAH